MLLSKKMQKALPSRIHYITTQARHTPAASFAFATDTRTTYKGKNAHAPLFPSSLFPSVPPTRAPRIPRLPVLFSLTHARKSPLLFESPAPGFTVSVGSYGAALFMFRSQCRTSDTMVWRADALVLGSAGRRDSSQAAFLATRAKNISKLDESAFLRRPFYFLTPPVLVRPPLPLRRIEPHPNV
jgi:hypothetical protein